MKVIVNFAKSETKKIETKFLTKISRYSENRSAILFPREVWDIGKQLRDKEVQVRIEEIIL